MKYYIPYIWILFMSVGQLYAQEIPVTGTWEVDDYEYEIDVKCQCTPAQKKAITKGIRASVRDEFDLISFDSYFEFDDANHVEGIIVEDEFETTYKQTGDNVTIYLDKDSIALKLVPQEYERLMILEFKEEELEDSLRSFEMDEVGQVDFRYTYMKFILINLFDDAYDDFTDERDFEED